jgi:hypothetical protein
MDRRKLAVYREAAGLSTWKALADRCGLSEAMTPAEPEKDDSNNNMRDWLRFSLAVGRHPFDLGYVVWPRVSARQLPQNGRKSFSTQSGKFGGSTARRWRG